jgi:hypothetical protein
MLESLKLPAEMRARSALRPRPYSVCAFVGLIILVMLMDAALKFRRRPRVQGGGDSAGFWFKAQLLDR